MTGLLEGKRALVTGAARGNGAAIARLLAAEGAAVALFDIDGQGAIAEAARIAAAGGGAALGGAADVCDAGAVGAAVAQTVAAFGGIDILVNNAGIFLDTPLPGVDMGVWEKTLAVNLTGPVRLIDAVVPGMIAQGAGGAIVNITSIAASVGFGTYLAYCASKSGLMGLTRAAAVSLAGHGIRVNAVAPGTIATEMTRELYANPAMLAAMVERVPLGRIADPTVVATAVLYLVSDLSAYVTGTELVVDGGFLSQ